MRKRMVAALGAAFIGGVVASSSPVHAAFGFCSQPMAPTTFMTKPTKPYCVNSGSCTEWDVQRYRNEIDRHFAALQRYAGEVDSFYNDAGAYIECMSDLD